MIKNKRRFISVLIILSTLFFHSQAGIYTAEAISMGDFYPEQLTGDGNSFISITHDGKVVGWGLNENGCLGLGHEESVSTPQEIPLTGVKEVASTNKTTFFLMEDGRLMASGSNNHGLFADGGASMGSLIPKEITSISKVKNITASPYHALALLEDGTVWGWGNNSKGELGLGYKGATITTPMKIDGLSGIKKLEAEDGFSVALMNDGSVKTWGSNEGGRLGIDESIKESLIPLKISDLGNASDIRADKARVYVLLNSGMLKVWGETESDRVDLTSIEKLRGVKQLDMGDGYILALMKDGTVRAWGDNRYGQLGKSTKNLSYSPQIMKLNISGVEQLTAGASTAFAILEDGSVKGWGRNDNHELGLGNSTISVVTPVNINNINMKHSLGYYLRAKEAISSARHTPTKIKLAQAKVTMTAVKDLELKAYLEGIYKETSEFLAKESKLNNQIKIENAFGKKPGGNEGNNGNGNGPIKPENPGNPNKPTEPNKPVEPGKPSEPEIPNIPEEPVIPPEIVTPPETSPSPEIPGDTESSEIDKEQGKLIKKAEGKLRLAEKHRRDPHLSHAQKAIDELKESPKKRELQKKLDAIR